MGALTLFGRSATEHELFAEHIANSEMFTVTHGHGREVHEWTDRPTGMDNHWFDCLVGCAVAASMSGARTGAEGERSAGRQRAPISMATMQAQRRAVG